MSAPRRLSFCIAGLVLIGFTACEEQGTTVERSAGESSAEKHNEGEGHVIACQMCYDEVRSVRETIKGPNLGTPRTIRTHMCPDCKANMKIYVNDDGVAMMKCPKCAPEGMPCDKCLPPKKG